ncbi:myosin-G heavy chain-like, partial [Myzus persicae]|uniref:myosin-G heavy chain-like n=1 Tax=Myzus persicae TaxID=13164 RepID=UPI000B9371FC
MEIQRKDKIIDDLRKSQVVPLPSTSKMFSSTNNQIDKTEANKLSENKNNTEQIQNTIEKSKVLNPTNNDNITTIVIKPDRDIPKTIYSKRMCQKLAQQNYTIGSKKQMSQNTNTNTNTADKITQDTNEDLNNDKDTSKEMSTSLIHNESKDIINSTLVICESDVTPSDCELDTTPVIQCDNQEKNKENVSIDSFFSKLKSPSKLKKKLIITPATIGVQNTHTKTFKCAKKINQNNSLASITECEITNSPEKPVEKSLNKDTLSTCIKNNFPDPKIEDKLLTTDILHNQPLLTSEKNNQIQSLNIEVEQFPIRRRKKVIEKDSNTLTLINKEKRSQKTVTCTSSSVDNEFNKSIENVKCLSMNNDRESSSPPQQKNFQSKCNFDTLECANSKTESKHLNNSCKSSFENTSFETGPTNRSVVSSINIEVKQVPITRKTKAIKKDNNTLNKSKKVTQEPCIKDHKNKYDSNTDDKQLSTDTLHNQKLSTYDDKKLKSSINIEVEQVPIIRKTK